MDRAGIVETARAEATRMRQLVESADPAGTVQMSIAQFAQLAAIIADLAGVAGASIAENPHGGAPGDPRYWVPLDHFSRLKARHDALERMAECGALGIAGMAADAAWPPFGAEGAFRG